MSKYFIRTRKQILFIYSDLAIVPGVNPITFNTLEEYTEFLEWQRGQGIDCPVLKLQKSFDTQNNEIYQVTSNVFSNDNLKLNYDEQNTKPIHNATMDNPQFNQGRMSFDPTNQQIGRYTGLDQMYHDKLLMMAVVQIQWIPIGVDLNSRKK